MNHHCLNEDDLIKFKVVMTSNASMKEVCVLFFFSSAYFIMLGTQFTYLFAALFNKFVDFTCFIKYKIVRVERDAG